MIIREGKISNNKEYFHLEYSFEICVIFKILFSCIVLISSMLERMPVSIQINEQNNENERLKKQILVRQIGNPDKQRVDYQQWVNSKFYWFFGVVKKRVAREVLNPVLVLLDWMNLYNLMYLIMSIMLFKNHYLCVYMMVDIIKNKSIIQVFQAIYLNLKITLINFILIIIFTYFYAIIFFVYFLKDPNIQCNEIT